MEAEENEQPELVAVEEAEIDVSESEGDGAGGAAGDQDQPETPNTARRFLPSSIGLTVLLPPGVAELEALITWGDYRTEPPLPESVLSGEEETRELGEDGKPIRRKRPNFDWVRVPKERSVKLRIVEGRGPPTIIPESGCEQRPGGGLQLETHARTFTYKRADGTMETVRAVTVFLVNRRNTAHRYHADVSYVVSGAARACLRAGVLRASRFRGRHPGLRSPRRRPPLSRRLRLRRGTKRSCRLGHQQGTSKCCRARLDRSAADRRSRTSRSKRRPRADVKSCAQHAISGASLGITRAAYCRVGRLPRVPLGEDKALIALLSRQDARIRYCPTAHVITSGRTHGRAPGGVADTLAIRSKEPEAFCDDALEPFRTAFDRALWRGRLRRLHAAGRLALDQDWAAELGLSACDVNDVIKEAPFGAAWNIIEDRSSLFARHLLRPAELPEQIAIARRSLSLLREGGSGARQHVQTKFSISIRPLDDADRSHSFGEESGSLVGT